MYKQLSWHLIYLIIRNSPSSISAILCTKASKIELKFFNTTSFIALHTKYKDSRLDYLIFASGSFIHWINGLVISSTNNFDVFSSSDRPIAIDERAFRPPFLYK